MPVIALAITVICYSPRSQVALGNALVFEAVLRPVGATLRGMRPEGQCNCRDRGIPKCNLGTRAEGPRELASDLTQVAPGFDEVPPEFNEVAPDCSDVSLDFSDVSLDFSDVTPEFSDVARDLIDVD